MTQLGKNHILGLSYQEYPLKDQKKSNRYNLKVTNLKWK